MTDLGENNSLITARSHGHSPPGLLKDIVALALVRRSWKGRYSVAEQSIGLWLCLLGARVTCSVHPKGGPRGPLCLQPHQVALPYTKNLHVIGFAIEVPSLPFFVLFLLLQYYS